MTMSILITNHNYGGFVQRAVQSALDQQGDDVEVVVVDDGSTDCSRELLRSYGSRITLIEQDQTGQSAALSAAFANSTGDVVCLLDADDWFVPGKVAAVRAAFTERPDALMAHHKMQGAVDSGTAVWAPWPRRVWTGDLRTRLERSGGWFPHATCSALSFRRSFLDHMFPLPDGARRYAGPLGEVEVEVEPDSYLLGAAALLAPVAGIPQALTCYRFHGSNKIAMSNGRDPATALNEAIARAAAELDAVRSVLAERFGRRPRLELEDHLEYQLLRHALGCISSREAVRQCLRAPALSGSMRLREATRVVLGRGISRRVSDRPGTTAR